MSSREIGRNGLPRRAFVEWAVLAALLVPLLGLAPSVAGAADAGSPDFEVTIQQGDTLTGLGQR